MLTQALCFGALFALALVEEAVTCPKLLCSAQEDATCLHVATDEIVLSQCPSGTYCPFFALSDLATTNCSETVNSPLSEPKCPSYSEEGEDCSATTLCSSEYYCKANKCARKRAAGAPCKSGEYCESGHICSSSLCVEYYSVKEDQIATDSMACESGILKNETCLAPAKTEGIVPKQCTAHTNCTATNGEAGECACAYDSEGRSFCELHRSDELSLEWRRLVHDGAQASAEFYTRSISSFPAFHRTPECFKELAYEVQELEIYKGRMNLCFGVLLGVAFVGYLL